MATMLGCDYEGVFLWLQEGSSRADSSGRVGFHPYNIYSTRCCDNGCPWDPDHLLEAIVGAEPVSSQVTSKPGLVDGSATELDQKFSTTGEKDL